MRIHFRTLSPTLGINGRGFISTLKKHPGLAKHSTLAMYIDIAMTVGIHMLES
jgi:hypothetical protein